MVAIVQGGPQTIDDRTAIGTDMERGSDRGQHVRGLMHVSEIEKQGCLRNRRSHANGDPGLANTSGAGEGHERDVVT